MTSSQSLPIRFSAQTGEDRRLLDYFRQRREGYYVEVGAFDGVEMSNSHCFDQLGWLGILVEADPDLAEQCRVNRPRATVVNCAAVAVGGPTQVTFQVASDNRGLSSLQLDSSAKSLLKSWTGRVSIREISVAAKTLDSILAENAVAQIDFMTIDVEGHEWSVLRGLDLNRWRPRVLILERNRALPDRRIFAHLQRYGYRYTGRTGVNDWYEFTGRNGLSLNERYRSILSLYLPSLFGLLLLRLRAIADKFRRLAQLT